MSPRGPDLKVFYQPRSLFREHVPFLNSAFTPSMRLRLFVPGNYYVRDLPLGLAYPLLSASATFVTPRLFYESRCSPPIRH